MTRRCRCRCRCRQSPHHYAHACRQFPATFCGSSPQFLPLSLSLSFSPSYCLSALPLSLYLSLGVCVFVCSISACRRCVPLSDTYGLGQQQQQQQRQQGQQHRAWLRLTSARLCLVVLFAVAVVVSALCFVYLKHSTHN